jgi:hypothetical protein
MPTDRAALLHYIWIKEGLDGYFTYYNPECNGFENHVSKNDKVRVMQAVGALARARARLDKVLHDVGLGNPEGEDD